MNYYKIKEVKWKCHLRVELQMVWQVSQHKNSYMIVIEFKFIYSKIEHHTKTKYKLVEEYKA